MRRAASDRFGRLELAILIWAVAVTDRPRAAAERVAASRGLTADQVLASPYYLIGTVEAIVDRVRELRERFGVSYLSVFPQDRESHDRPHFTIRWAVACHALWPWCNPCSER